MFSKIFHASSEGYSLTKLTLQKSILSHLLCEQHIYSLTEAVILGSVQFFQLNQPIFLSSSSSFNVILKEKSPNHEDWGTRSPGSTSSCVLNPSNCTCSHVFPMPCIFMYFPCHLSSCISHVSSCISHAMYLHVLTLTS